MICPSKMGCTSSSNIITIVPDDLYELIEGDLKKEFIPISEEIKRGGAIMDNYEKVQKFLNKKGIPKRVKELVKEKMDKKSIKELHTWVLHYESKKYTII